ncbi:MAG: hypothetical protein ACFFBZ_13400, partial [Promethearchaeota archaeon]
MTLKENIDSLLNKALDEERNYNWIEAAALYEKVAKHYLDENLVEKAADCYKSLGYSHARGADTVETAEDYLKQINCAIKAYRDASKFYKELRNKSAELECEAEIYFTSGFLATSDREGQKAYLEAIKLFRE